MSELFSDPTIWAGLATLTVMEIVLGIDNIIFISILAARLPRERQSQARLVGLSLAAITRVLLLLGISWLVSLTAPFATIFGHTFSGRDLILLAGGIFLVYKAVKEIHEKLEGEGDESEEGKAKVTFTSVIVQIVLLDIIFSLDSVITAVGMTNHLWVMITATLIALGVMIWAGGKIGDFVLQHPTVKMLALAFLLLIGVSLSAEAFHKEIPKGYIYSAMAFSVLVESLNLISQKRKTKKKGIKVEPVQLHQNVVGMDLENEE
ncbi:MAG: TerC family protein [Ignavibacteriae bacterium]|nr:TerC family protein [Ignavibacteriota bacterium]MCB9214841.1 TerC family protein [Ignavibacteria bacterium]